MQELASERDKLNKQIPELQKQLETELLARTDLENRNMTLREELAFKQQVELYQNRRSERPINHFILLHHRCMSAK